LTKPVDFGVIGKALFMAIFLIARDHEITNVYMLKKPNDIILKLIKA
jgi:hypothetical protein